MSFEVILVITAFFGLLLLNVPIAFCIGVSALLGIYTMGTVPAPFVMSQRMATGIASFPLLAIPFFILSGVLMGESGMARRLMDFAVALVGGLRGGLSYVNTITCMLFGSLSGSATAAVSSVGSFMIPEMERKGYSRSYAVAITTTSATTGLLIPPSNVMIIYAVVAGNVSVASLFMAGIIPGIVVGLLLMLVAFVGTFRKSSVTARADDIPVPGLLRSFLSALPSLGLIFVVLGGILGGVFSATEASAIAVAYAFILGVVAYREIPLSRLPAILLRGAKMTSIVMLLVGMSQTLSWFLAYEGIPQQVSNAVIALSDNPLLILLLLNLVLLLVGAFLDMTPAVLIFTPIFLPVVLELGMDPVHFGIMLIANLCIGLCTPPVGTCLFVGCSVGRVPIVKVIAPIIPFFLAMVVALLLITYLPFLTMWLPEVLGL